MRFARFSLALVIVLALAGPNVTGCLARPLLYDVGFYPETISPNADGRDDAANILYKLSRNASLSIYFIGEAGERQVPDADIGLTHNVGGIGQYCFVQILGRD